MVVAFGVLVLSPARALAAPEEACPNASLRAALNSVPLPDCRAYEMVSPSFKAGYGFYATGISRNGERAMLFSLDGAGASSAGEGVQSAVVYLATRSPAGWRLEDLNGPSSEFAGEFLIPYSAEVESGETLWEQHTLKQSAFLSELYVRSASGVFTRIGPLTPHKLGSKGEESDVITGSEDDVDLPVAATRAYSHVLLEAETRKEQNWSFDETKGVTTHSLYEYSGVENEHPMLVGVEGPEKEGNTKLIGKCGVQLGSSGDEGAYNALSADGETVFFTVEPTEPGVSGGCEAAAPATAEVYARLHGSRLSPEEAKTVHVSASECTTACGSEESGKNYEGASENGEKVFFTSTQKLTNGAVDTTEGGRSATHGEEGCAATDGEEGVCNLYEYDFDAPSAECQIEHKCLELISGGDVLGVTAIAENGERVYFVSKSKLVSEGPVGREPVEHEPNLYVYDTVTGTTAFVATLGGADGGDWKRRSYERTAEVAGEGGRYLVFASTKKGVTPDDTSEQTQLYEYKAQAQSESPELVRITQGEDGYNENGNGVAVGAGANGIEEINKEIGSNFRSAGNDLTISEDGRTVFFETAGQLSPRALSAEQRCTSVYEFRTAGRLSEGEVHLISDGRDTQLYKGFTCGAEFFAMDATGANVLIGTADPLISTDVDGVQRDVYDAREDGGVPLPPAAPERPACGPGGCAPDATGTPALAAVGPAVAEAPLAAVSTPAKPRSTSPPSGKRRCPKGRRLRHSRCVKSKRKRGHGDGKAGKGGKQR